VGGPPAWGLGGGLTTLPRKTLSVSNHYAQPRNRTDYLAQPKHWKMDIGKLAWGVWIGLDWLRTGTGGGLL
jgi:hypothetical protein